MSAAAAPSPATASPASKLKQDVPVDVEESDGFDSGDEEDDAEDGDYDDDACEDGQELGLEYLVHGDLAAEDDEEDEAYDPVDDGEEVEEEEEEEEVFSDQETAAAPTALQVPMHLAADNSLPPPTPTSQKRARDEVEDEDASGDSEEQPSAKRLKEDAEA